jgi:hypothetical protein
MCNLTKKINQNILIVLNAAKLLLVIHVVIFFQITN